MSVLVTKMFILRRIPADATITYAQLERCILDDLRCAIEVVKGNPCPTLLDGHRSLLGLVVDLRDAGVIELVRPGESDAGYRRTQLAVEWEAGLRTRFPGLQRTLDTLPMSPIGLLDALARG